MKRVPCILTIAGSDSGGGAGIQADIKSITMQGGFSLSVITALTAQNGLGVTGIHAPDASFMCEQLNAVLDGFPVAAAKTGMLFSADIINALANALEALPQETRFPLVVDPVCVSQSGHSLLQPDAVEALRTRMIPLATLLTPNRPEAELLAGMSIANEADAKEACKRLMAMGASAVLLKGGHFDDLSGSDADSDYLIDWFAEKDSDIVALPQRRVHTTNNHGTGCTLSASIATHLGLGETLKNAVIKAQDYLNHALQTSYAPGKGTGPANHAWVLEK